MSHQAIQKVAPISASASSRRVTIGQTHSILTDPQSRWVATRQGAINAAFETRMSLIRGQAGGSQPSSAEGSPDAGTPSDGELRSSGEGDRLGQVDWDQTTPFGGHSGVF